MVWPFNKRAAPTVEEELAYRAQNRSNGRAVTRKGSLAHSAVWGCLRLRADLISTMPVDVFKRTNGHQVELTKPPVLEAPGGPDCRMVEWLFSSQWDLDSVGNAFGLITLRDGRGLPSRIELLNTDECVLRSRGGVLTLVVNGEPIPYERIWHERQYTIAGSPIGLSPISYAAMTISGYLSAQRFAADWFDNSATPAAHLKNSAKVLNKTEARKVKEQFKSSIRDGDVFVTGKDWDYSLLSAKASESSFIESMNFSVTDVCRFLGVPADMIDAHGGGNNITYANISQRNLQFLIMNLGPAIVRREEALSHGLLPAPRYLKFNTDSLLRMDLKSRYEAYAIAVNNRWKTPSRILELENEPPLSEADIAEFARLFPQKSDTPKEGKP